MGYPGTVFPVPCIMSVVSRQQLSALSTMVVCLGPVWLSGFAALKVCAGGPSAVSVVSSVHVSRILVVTTCSLSLHECLLSTFSFI
jgi:hypothetical protein